MKSQERKKEKKFSRGVPLREKDLESHKLIQYRVQLQGVEDKDLPGHKVPVEVSPPDKRKNLHARIAIKIIMVYID